MTLVGVGNSTKTHASNRPLMTIGAYRPSGRHQVGAKPIRTLSMWRHGTATCALATHVVAQATPAERPAGLSGARLTDRALELNVGFDLLVNCSPHLVVRIRQEVAQYGKPK